MAPPSAFLPDLRSPRSPKRFFNFSKDPLPPLPPPAPTAAYSPPPVKVTHTANSSFSSNNSSPLGQGAQIVRRPSDARRAMRQPFTAGLPTSTSSRGDFRESPPASAPMLRPRPSQPSMPSPPHEVKPMRPQVSISHLDRRSTLKLKPSISSTSSSISPSWDTPEWEWGIRSRRSTVRPPPRPSPPSPFNAILLSHSSRPSPTASSHVLINLSFGYSLDDPPSNNTITIPWERICRAGGHLARFVERHLGDEAEEEGKPDMTDGESADDSDLDSDYGLGELLRDDYLNSLLLSSTRPDTHVDLPPVPVLPLKIRDKLLPKIDTSFDSKTRARTRNQYTQQLLYPSPSSPFVTGPTEPLQIRRKVASLHLGPREVESGGAITELKILLLRDAAVYGPIAHRLIYGMFPPMEGKRRKAEEECIWLGMEGLAEETAARLKGQKSMVLKGGEGYI